MKMTSKIEGRCPSCRRPIKIEAYDIAHIIMPTQDEVNV